MDKMNNVNGEGFFMRNYYVDGTWLLFLCQRQP